MARIAEALLIFTVTAFRLSIVTGADELAADSQFSGFKKGFAAALAVGEAVGELKAVTGLDTFDGNAFAGKMRDGLA